MPELRLPLVGAFNPRGPYGAYANTITTGQDQLFDNCIFEIAKNPVTGSANVYCQKPYATTSNYNVSDVSYPGGKAIYAAEFGTTTWVVSAFGAASHNFSSPTKIYVGSPTTAGFTSMGVTSGCVTNIVETIISSINFFLMTSSDGTGWFLAKDSITSNNTSINVSAAFTADIANGSPTLSNVSSFSGRYIGQLLTAGGSLLPADARILSMNSGAGTITMTLNATGTQATASITADRIAKIIDSDFPTDAVGPFACLGGYNHIMTTSGKIYASGLNTILTWGAGDFLPTNFYPDNGRGGVWVINSRIAAISSSSFEWFYNAGNPSGSPLSPSPELNFEVGALNATAICRLDDQFFWLSSFQSGDAAIYTLAGGPKRISSEQLNVLISSVPVTQPFPLTLTAVKLYGKRYLIFAGLFALDMETDIWSYWSASGVNNSLICRATGVFGVGTYTTSSATVYYIDTIRNDIYSLGIGTIGSASAFATMKVRTSRLDLGTGNRKFVQYYELDSDIQSSGTATLEVSDDDYATWTTVGTFDMTKLAPRIYRGGSFKGGRAHRITHSASTPFRASTLTIKYAVGQT